MTPLSSARTRAGLTQLDLAKLLVEHGIYSSIAGAQAHVSRFEAGQREPGLRAALCLATAVGCRVDQLWPLEGRERTCQAGKS